MRQGNLQFNQYTIATITSKDTRTFHYPSRTKADNVDQWFQWQQEVRENAQKNTPRP